MPTAALVVCLIVLISKGFAVPIFNSGAREHRESTPEILDLEQQLKSQAGEDKQVASEPPTHNVHLPPLEPSDEEAAGIDAAMLDELKAAQAQGQGAIPAKLIPGMSSSVAEDVLDDDDDDDEADLLNASQGINTPDSDDDIDDDDEEEEEDEATAEEDVNDYPGIGEEEDDSYMQSMLSALRKHPEMLQQLMGDTDSEKMRYNGSPEDSRAALQAEYLAAAGGNDGGLDNEVADGMNFGEYKAWPSDFNPYRERNGDHEAREVAKKRGYGPPEEDHVAEEEHQSEHKRQPVIPLVPMGFMR